MENWCELVCPHLSEAAAREMGASWAIFLALLGLFTSIYYACRGQQELAFTRRKEASTENKNKNKIWAEVVN